MVTTLDNQTEVQKSTSNDQNEPAAEAPKPRRQYTRRTAAESADQPMTLDKAARTLVKTRAAKNKADKKLAAAKAALATAETAAQEATAAYTEASTTMRAALTESESSVSVTPA